MKPKPPPTFASSSKPLPSKPKEVRPQKKRLMTSQEKLRIERDNLPLLLKSLDTSVTSIKKILQVLATASPDVVNILERECSVIFECRLCKNLFRSVANFSIHKRSFCTKSINEAHSKHKHAAKMQYSKCKESNIIESRSTARKDIIDLINTVKHITQKEVEPKTTSYYEEFPEITTQALFRIRYDSEGVEKDKTEVVKPTEATSSTSKNQCNMCDLVCASQKALAIHLKKSHTGLRLVFICPCCKKCFANSWSVYRHLFSVHKKTNEQVRKLRPNIQQKHITEDEFNKKKVTLTPTSTDKRKEQRAFMEDLVGHSSLHRCAECGKRFDRVVALISHAGQCKKKLMAPPDLCRSLKRKALNPIKIDDEKKAKFSENISEDMLAVAGCSKSFKDQLSPHSPERDVDVSKFIDIYKSNVDIGEVAYGDLLDKLHMEVSIDETNSDADSDICKTQPDLSNIESSKKESVNKYKEGSIEEGFEGFDNIEESSVNKYKLIENISKARKSKSIQMFNNKHSSMEPISDVEDDESQDKDEESDSIIEDDTDNLENGNENEIIVIDDSQSSLSDSHGEVLSNSNVESEGSSESEDSDNEGNQESISDYSQDREDRITPCGVEEEEECVEVSDEEDEELLAEEDEPGSVDEEASVQDEEASVQDEEVSVQDEEASVQDEESTIEDEEVEADEELELEDAEQERVEEGVGIEKEDIIHIPEDKEHKGLGTDVECEEIVELEESEEEEHTGEEEIVLQIEESEEEEHTGEEEIVLQIEEDVENKGVSSNVKHEQIVEQEDLKTQLNHKEIKVGKITDHVEHKDVGADVQHEDIVNKERVKEVAQEEEENIAQLIENYVENEEVVSNIEYEEIVEEGGYIDSEELNHEEDKLKQLSKDLEHEGIKLKEGEVLECVEQQIEEGDNEIEKDKDSEKQEMPCVFEEDSSGLSVHESQYRNNEYISSGNEFSKDQTIEIEYVDEENIEIQEVSPDDSAIMLEDTLKTDSDEVNMPMSGAGEINRSLNCKSGADPQPSCSKYEEQNEMNASPPSPIEENHNSNQSSGSIDLKYNGFIGFTDFEIMSNNSEILKKHLQISTYKSKYSKNMEQHKQKKRRRKEAKNRESSLLSINLPMNFNEELAASTNTDSPSDRSSNLSFEDDDADSIDKGDWVARKINSFMNANKKKCLLCFKTFHRVNFVRRHVASHYSINKFKCLVNSCNFQCYLRSDMNNHLIKIHKKKDFESFVDRLNPTKDDFSDKSYTHDPKPIYVFEQSFLSHNSYHKNGIKHSDNFKRTPSISPVSETSLDELDVIEESCFQTESPELYNGIEEVMSGMVEKEEMGAVVMNAILGGSSDLNEEYSKSRDSSLMAS